MTEQEAKGFIALLMAVPDSRRASISVEFIRYVDSDDINPQRQYTACFFIGAKCFVAYGKTAEEAVVNVIHEWAKIPLRLVGEV